MLNNDPNKKSHSIHLKYVPGLEELTKLCSFYAENIRKQCIFLKNEDKGINYLDSQPVSLTVSFLKEKNMSFLENIVKGDNVCLYENRNNIQIPLNVSNLVISQSSMVNIKVNNDFDENIEKVVTIEKEYTTVLIGKAFSFKYKDGTAYDFEFRNFGNLNAVQGLLFARFIIAVNKNIDKETKPDEFLFGIVKECLKNAPKTIFEGYYIFYECAIKASQVGVELKHYTVAAIMQSRRAINLLYESIIEDKPIKLNDASDIGIYYQKIAGRYLLLVYRRSTEYADRYILKQYLKEDYGVGIYIDFGNGNERVANWMAVLPEYITKLEFDRKKFIKEMNISNQNEMDLVNLYVLAFIAEYDISKECEDLEYANELNEKLLQYAPHQNINLINKLQIKKRKEQLEESEKELLFSLKQDPDIKLHTAVCILLEQYDEAAYCLKNMEIEDREAFKRWPIYYLLH
jgi:hypothetical protein